MHRLILNVRLLSLVAAVVVAVVAAGSLGPPRQAEAATVTDPTGVICGALHDLVIDGNPLPFAGTVLARFDDDVTPGSFQLTAVAYTTPIGSASNMPDCKTPKAFPGDVVVPDAAAEVRPSVSGLTFTGGDTLAGSSCQEEFLFAGQLFPGWTLINVELVLSKAEPGTQSLGFFRFDTPYANEALCLAAGATTTTIVVQFDTLYQDGPDEDIADFDSDWDKDGCSDWTELMPDPLVPHSDPFDPTSSNCPVGGVAELPDVATTPLDVSGSSGSNAGLIATLVAIAAAAATTMGAGALYARKRLTR